MINNDNISVQSVENQRTQSSNIVVIVPSYQCEKYVAETLRSLMDQGDALLGVDRIILTDDASTDRTIEIARATWRGPIALEVRAAPKNRGEYINMNECIAALPAHIEWYLVMHADNLAKQGWLSTLQECIRSAGACTGSICTSWDNFDDAGNVLSVGENRVPLKSELIEGNDASVAGTLRQGCWWHISSCATRVQVYREVGGLPQGFRLKGDWDFMLRMLKSGWDIEYVPAALMNYRMNPEGSSSVSFLRHKDVFETLEIFQRHQLVLSIPSVARYHIIQLWRLTRRLVGAVFRGNGERAILVFPMAAYVMKSFFICLGDRRTR